MPAIKSIGTYVPYYRLNREEIGRAWGGFPQTGEKAVANFDEDCITLAVEAGRNCLKGVDYKNIDGLYFASSTAPFKEKQCASIIAAALDLKTDVFTVDFTNTLRAGTNALRAAIDSIKAGSAKNLLLVAADCRLGVPGSSFEYDFGDGSAALLISNEGYIEFEESYTHTSEIIDQWRTDSHSFVKTWEDRFVYTKGYMEKVKEATGSFLERLNISVQDINKVALNAPNLRQHQQACKMLKLDTKNQVQNPMFNTLGNTGTAFALMIFMAAIEEADTNDRLLLINYGDGTDLFLFKVKEQLTLNKDQKGINDYINSKNILKNYEKYIQLRKLMEVETGRRRPAMVSSPVVINRDRTMIYPLHGSECTNCGRSFFPPQRICVYCQAKDQNKEISLSDRKGTLFTFCKDILAQSVDPPVIISVVNLEGNLRFFGSMTDRDPDKIELDMPVELTFRKMSEAGEYGNYFWKCRPLR